jgi:hypothetical protein
VRFWKDRSADQVRGRLMPDPLPAGDVQSALPELPRKK